MLREDSSPRSSFQKGRFDKEYSYMTESTGASTTT